MKRSGLLAILSIALVVVGCGARSIATSPKASRSPAARRTPRHPAPAAQRTDERAASMDETFDDLRRLYRDAKIRERHSGTASYYADSLAGRSMANGQAYDPIRPTMAHRTLPFGTVVRVIRVSTGAAVIVQVADRGPFGKRRRIADLSREAARRLDMIRDGVVDVRLEVLRRDGEGSTKLPRPP